VRLMNDSVYGLTASIWTNAQADPKSEEAFLKIEEQLECGTVFLNRCVATESKLGRVFIGMQVRLSGPRARVDGREGERPRRQSQQVW
jgi:acyl-CoA reductase-like NAD-dependent aldehyde dehydrogenase